MFNKITILFCIFDQINADFFQKHYNIRLWKRYFFNIQLYMF